MIVSASTRNVSVVGDRKADGNGNMLQYGSGGGSGGGRKRSPRGLRVSASSFEAMSM